MSSVEAETQLISEKLKYITKQELDELSENIDMLNRMMTFLIISGYNSLRFTRY